MMRTVRALGLPLVSGIGILPGAITAEAQTKTAAPAGEFSVQTFQQDQN